MRRSTLMMVLMAATLGMGGCATLSNMPPLSRETIAEESTFQALNAIDFMQTTQIARHPGSYYEDGTMSLFTGKHPSEGQVVFYSLAIGTLGHLGTTLLVNDLTHDEGPWATRSWEAASLAWKFRIVITNHEHGLSFTTNF